MKLFAFAEKPYEGEVGGNPVQDSRRTMKTLREINVSVPVAHAPIVSPLARDLVLHGFPETLENIGKSNVSGHWKHLGTLRKLLFRGSTGTPGNPGQPRTTPIPP